MRETLLKSERLSSKKAIERLFDRKRTDGGTLLAYPCQVIFMPNQETNSRVLFTVSKKKFKKAVDRNRIKRLLREAYRKQKALTPLPQSLDLGFILVAKEMITFEECQKGMKKAFTKLLEATNEGAQS
ncbi:MAG: ribonuclease P protein component [Spirosomataceae bacterium]